MWLSIVALLLASPALADEPKQGARMLFVTYSGGFRHGSVTRPYDKLKPEEKAKIPPADLLKMRGPGGELSVAERAMTNLGISSSRFRVDCTQNPGQDLTKENLQNYQIVMFYTTGPRKAWADVSDATFEYFLGDWLKQPGHGFIGAHSAADTLGDYEPYWDMIGGTFNGHPWGSGDTVTITVHDQKHPVSKVWPAELTLKDEIYRFRHWQPEKVRVLMSLDMSKTAKKADYHVPIAWVKEYGQGKAMHMSLGHREDVWENPTYMQSMLGGVEWILGIQPGDATPNPDLSSAQEAKAKADYAAAVAAGDKGVLVEKKVEKKK
jgi:type 1 glutamine amidotransferase